MDAVNYGLLAVSVTMNVLAYGVVRNDFCKREIKNGSDLNLFNASTSLLSMLVLLLLCLFMDTLRLPSLYTLLLGIVFGVSTALCALLNMKALESGPLSYTSVIISCSMVIPALSGMLLYGELVTLWQFAGIVLMVVSFCCAVDQKNGESGTSFRWLLFCLGAFLFSGAVGVLQKVHQNSAFKEELGVFLVIAFGVSSLLSFGLVRWYGYKRGEAVTVLSPSRRRKFLFCSLFCGVGIALCNQINMYLAGAMPSIIFFPVVNGASMILTSAAGILLWREKLSARQWFGLVTGAAAIFLLCNIL